MSGIGSASCVASPLFRAENGLVIMGGALYIHDLNPDVARQWIGVLETITAEGSNE